MLQYLFSSKIIATFISSNNNQTNKTMKFNKSEIFKAAWNLVKTTGKTISAALKSAWEAVRIVKTELEIKLENLGVENFKLVAENLNKISDVNFEIWSNYGKVRAYLNFRGTNKNKKTFIDLLTGNVTNENAWSLVNSALKNTNFNY